MIRCLSEDHHGKLRCEHRVRYSRDGNCLSRDGNCVSCDSKLLTFPVAGRDRLEALLYIHNTYYIYLTYIIYINMLYLYVHNLWYMNMIRFISSYNGIKNYWPP